MPDYSSNNKRIAKNTLLLYFRTMLIMIVTLYTSRVVLQTLGVEDYGVYNAVGGVVTMFAVITGALSNAISRYITYGLGEGNKEKLKLVFCTSVNIQILISVIILVLCEVIGLWFLNSKMNIPPDRLQAANWVLHFSLLTFVVNLISVPYNACIIAHEHMQAYAYISIIDALLKLSVAIFLIISPVDKLITYTILLFVAALGVRVMYGVYCGKHFEECSYKPIYDKGLSKEVMKFAGWNFLTNGASIVNVQGVNLLINVYFGVIANSARGIAAQVDAAVNQFVATFTTAVNPQITKSYAEGDKQRMFYLICKGAKFSYYLLLIFVIPIYFEADKILELWLVNVPSSAVLFVRLSLLGMMVTCIGNTGVTACMATGKIKQYSIWITLVGSLVIVVTWIAYYLGSPVEITYYIYIVVYVLVQFVRLLIMKSLIGFPIIKFLREVVAPISIVTVAAIPLPWLITQIAPESFYRAVMSLLVSLLCTCLSIYLMGLTKAERITVKDKALIIVRKINK